MHTSTKVFDAASTAAVIFLDHKNSTLIVISGCSVCTGSTPYKFHPDQLRREHGNEQALLSAKFATLCQGQGKVV